MVIDISPILQDNTSGSFKLAQKMMQLFKQHLDAIDESSTELDAFYEAYQVAGKKIIKFQPNMVLLRKTHTQFLSFFKRLLKADNSLTEIKNALSDKVEEICSDLNRDLNNIAASGSKIIANFNKIFTYGNNTAVIEILKKAISQKRKFEVYCSKSSPSMEGINLARYLSERGMKTTLCEDAQIGTIINDMSLVVIGADRLYEEGIVNKAGTLAVCLLAKYYGIRVYLAVETSKVLKTTERSIKNSERNPSEVYTGVESFTVVNNYYEKIPFDLIHKVICEEGVFEIAEFKSWYLGE